MSGEVRRVSNLQYTNAGTRWYFISKDKTALAFMKQHGGLQWTEVKHKIIDAIVDAHRGMTTLGGIIIEALPVIPTRTGYLADFIWTSMFMSNTRYYSQFSMRVSFKIPTAKRPYPIIGHVSHMPPARGYGAWGTVKLQHVIPNVKVIRVLPSGNAIYELNDPAAMNNYVPKIREIIRRKLVESIKSVVDQAILQCTAQWDASDPTTALNINDIQIK